MNYIARDEVIILLVVRELNDTEQHIKGFPSNNAVQLVKTIPLWAIPYRQVQIQLYYGGSQMNDNFDLHYYGVDTGDIIMLSSRLQDGARIRRTYTLRYLPAKIHDNSDSDTDLKFTPNCLIIYNLFNLYFFGLTFRCYIFIV